MRARVSTLVGVALLGLGGVAALPAPARSQATFVAFDSDAGDYIGQGLYQVFHEGNALVSAELNFDGGVTVTVDGPDYWTLDFDAPVDGPLAVGAYEGATRFPFNGGLEPGLSVSGAGRGCNELSGRFDVHELELDPGDAVVRFSADFEQHCEGMGPALHGSVRLDAALRPVPGDIDGDGWTDKLDNCPGIANTLQVDTDGNGRGDGCGLEADAQRCVYELNKRGAAVAKAQGAAGVACLKNAAKGATTKLGTPATAQDCLTNDVGGKVAGASAKLLARDALLCVPPPAFGYTGGIAVGEAAIARGVARVAELFGPDLDAALRPAATDAVGAKCQEDVLRTTGAAVDALLKLALKHKKAILAAQKVVGASDTESLGELLLAALGDASDPKIAKAAGGIASAAAKRCGAAADLPGAFPGCAAAADVAEVTACAQSTARCDACLTLEVFDGLSVDCDAFDDGDGANASCP
jgi:hypothetical protein